MTIAEMKDLLLQNRHAAATLTRDNIPSEKGLYVWYSTSSGEALYVGKATGRAGLRQRIWGQHLNPKYLESRAEKFQPEDEFQRSCGVLVAGKVGVDKSVFRRSIGRNHRLAPGEDSVRYIQQNLSVAWLTLADLVGEVTSHEVELIRELKPKLNVSGILKTRPQRHLSRTECRRQIVLDFAKWTALSALRSGAPVKSRMHVYRLLDAVGFGEVVRTGSPITGAEFDTWHEAETLALCARDRRVPTGWATKLINIYLKTAAYVGDIGRPGLRDVLHPPIDAGLWQGLAEEFCGRQDIVGEACCVRRIKDITDYPTYRRIIAGCRAAANDLGCSLIEVEQLWRGTVTP